MISYKIKNNLKNSAESLILKYNLFLTNRQYRTIHFANEEEYLKIQKDLSIEIEVLDNSIKDCLKIYFEETFPEYEFIAYDSRFINISSVNHQLGKVLIKNIANDIEVQKVEKKFMEESDLTIIVERFEELPEEIKNTFQK